jgi:hypothetical protein
MNLDNNAFNLFKPCVMKLKQLLILSICTCSFQAVFAQFVTPTPERNVISTAVPILSLEGNVQSRGMAEIGVVASDLNQQNGLSQNPAILARNNKVFGIQGLNYLPWLRRFVPDINFFETGFYRSINNNNAIGLNIKYFSLGKILFNDDFGNLTNSGHNAYEMSIAAKYAHRISRHWSIGSGLKFIYSDLGGNSLGFHPGKAVSGDIGIDYRTHLVDQDFFKIKWNFGSSIVDLGNKISYSNTDVKQFLPQTLKIGTLFTFLVTLKNGNFIATDLAYQADKLLVPTPPIFALDANGSRIPDGRGGFVIAKGFNPNVNFLQGAIQSFYDAPGGSEEELKEILHRFGTETRFCLFHQKMLIACRGGYLYEDFTKGGRRYITTGLGIGFKGIRLDAAYLYSTTQFHPNNGIITYSIGARFNLDSEKKFRFIED